MKRCPNCQRTYPDDAPGFCVNDGTQLVNEEAAAFDPQKTILASTPAQPPPPPMQQYSNPAPSPSPPPAAWPPPPPPGQHQQGQQPQAQNWGGYYQQPGQQPYSQPYAPPVAAGGKGLSLGSFLTGLISFLAVSLIFLMGQQVIDYDRDVATISFWGSTVLGLVAIVLGALALISRRQRSKWMAIVGIILGIPALLFFAYVLINYGVPT
jgi:hypothetical protein